MAYKRKAQEAFGKPNGQLSAFAAARLTQKPNEPGVETEAPTRIAKGVISATALADAPYDGHHGGSEPSSDDDVESKMEMVTTAKLPPVTPLSTIGPGSVMKADDESLKVALQIEEAVTCVGIYDIEVLEGFITIYGAVLNPKSGRQRIYAPSSHALPRIVARKSGAIIRLLNVESGLCELERLSPLFKNIWPKADRSFVLLHISSEDVLQRPLNALEVDKMTQQALARITSEAQEFPKSSRIMAMGAKSTGKSTFNRLLCNSFNSKLSAPKTLYLDLDPGQPEFSPPGQISLVEITAPLLGPAFTHFATPKSGQYKLLRCHTIAASSFKDNPDYYLRYTKDLMEYANPRQPLIINTCGWISGLGLGILVEIAGIVGATDLAILEPVEEALMESLKLTVPAAVLHRLPRQPPKPSPRTPAELRNMQTMAYFHQKLTASADQSKWSSLPVSAIRPWVAKYDAPDSGIHAIISYSQAPSPEFLAEVLDGSIVAMVTVDEQYLMQAINPEEPQGASDLLDNPIQRTAEGLPYIQTNDQDVCHPLNQTYISYVGLALLRAIDTQRKELHLVTPLPESQIADLVQKKVFLVRGSFDAPEWAYLEDMYCGGDLGNGANSRPWVSLRESVGVEGAVWRLRRPPVANAPARPG